MVSIKKVVEYLKSKDILNENKILLFAVLSQGYKLLEMKEKIFLENIYIVDNKLLGPEKYIDNEKKLKEKDIEFINKVIQLFDENLITKDIDSILINMPVNGKMDDEYFITMFTFLYQEIYYPEIIKDLKKENYILSIKNQKLEKNLFYLITKMEELQERFPDLIEFKSPYVKAKTKYMQ